MKDINDVILFFIFNLAPSSLDVGDEIKRVRFAQSQTVLEDDVRIVFMNNVDAFYFIFFSFFFMHFTSTYPCTTLYSFRILPTVRRISSKRKTYTAARIDNSPPVQAFLVYASSFYFLRTSKIASSISRTTRSVEVFDRIGVNACPSTDSVFFRCNIQFLFLILLYYSLKNTKNGDKNDDDDFVVSLSSAEKKVAFGRVGEQKQQKQRQR